MRINGSREIEVKKDDLISTIRKHKENHQVEYAKAVEAYKIEAKKQLLKQLKALKNGSLEIRVNLVAPSNKTDEYDKIIEMFIWEIKDTVTLSQGEFNEYILDETSFAREAKLMNSHYLNLGP